jgi:glycine oxidase
MTKDVLIVGGGVIGLSIARELHKRGVGKITVVDAGTCASEASWAAAGMLGPQAEADESGPFFDLCVRSRDLYPAFADELLEETGVDIELDRAGTFYLAFSADDLMKMRERFDWQRAAGMDVELVDAKSVRAAEPFVSPDVIEALYFAGDWQVDNRKICSALRQYCEMKDIELRENTAVNEVLSNAKKAYGVRTDPETLIADEVILAAGAWTSNILLSERLQLPAIEPVLGQMIAFRTESRVFQRVIYCRDGYIVPRRDGRVLAGSTTEKTGFKRKTTDTAASALFSMACTIAPDLATRAIDDHWCGLRPRAVDGLPIIGRPNGIDGLFIATAHYRNGILLAPVTAALAADTIMGSDRIADDAIFGPDRFHPIAAITSIQ